METDHIWWPIRKKKPILDLSKIPMPPDGKDYNAMLFKPPPFDMDWEPPNRYAKYSDVIQRALDSEPNGMVSQLCSNCWEVINVLKGLVQLGKLRETEK